MQQSQTYVIKWQKKIQSKIREFSHYRGAFTVLSKHKKAIESLGLPLTVGEVDLVDRKRNYIDERKSELRIPICGERDGGIMVVRAERDEDGEDFETAQIELVLDEAGHNIIIYDNGKWSGSLILLGSSNDICSILPSTQFCCHFKN
ncbi:Cytochrome c oxidase assembly factor [Dirofilaria immitis]